jgi:branched-chain amino acid transport system permease protein
MAGFLQQVVEGLGSGAIYASLALALVLIYRFTGIVNFAQGELAMFSTYVAWQFVAAGMPFWLALVLTLAVSFAGGMLIERVIIRPVEGAPELTLVIVTVGLFIFVNAAAGWIWSFLIKDFPNPFPDGAIEAGGLSVGYSTLGILGVVAVVMGLLYVLFRYTKIGLGMRAVAADPRSARLVGIRVGRMLALGWGLAATVGAVSGVLVAPLLFLEPNMMGGVLIYAFAAATLGGFDSPGGAVVGGLIVGVAETLAGAYVGFVGSDLKVGVPLVIILGVLLLRPQGLFGATLRHEGATA